LSVWFQNENQLLCRILNVKLYSVSLFSLLLVSFLTSFNCSRSDHIPALLTSLIWAKANKCAVQLGQ